MNSKTPVLDNRTSKDIYEQALELTRKYCPDLKIPETYGYFDPDDPGLVILKLFSELTGYLLNQLNQIPDKHRLAFLDFIGLELLAARPARVPLTFYLAERSRGALVPAGIAVASSGDPGVVFETEKSLSVVPAKLSGVYSINPWYDKYTDSSDKGQGDENGFLAFGKDPDEKNLDHILYTGDDIKLDIRRVPEKLEIHLKGKDLSDDFFRKWCEVKPDGKTKPVNVKSISPENRVTNNLDIGLDIKKLDRSSINGATSFWLSVRPGEDKIITSEEGLPEITDVTIDITVKNIIPEAAFFNDTPIDVKKGFYPFGEQPKKGDTLYIGSDETFSKKGSTITLGFNTEKLKSDSAGLRWEFWDGARWKELKEGFEDKVEASFETVTFTCPSIQPVKINGQLNRWIRVVIESGGYGTEGKLSHETVEDIIKKLSRDKKLSAELEKNKQQIIDVLGDNGYLFRFEYHPPSYDPPFIESITASYNYTDEKLNLAKTFNNFRFEDFTPGTGSKPYVPRSGMPSLYLGFEDNIASKPVNLFFAVKEKLYSEKPEVIRKDRGNANLLTEAEKPTGLAWKYYNGNIWKDLGFEDETDYFNTVGIISFYIPPDISKTQEFGRKMYWIKVEIMDGEGTYCPGFKGIFPNTVWAQNHVTVENEVLGSGTGEPGLSVFFSKKPVLENQIIEVKENKPGEIKEEWIRWNEVKDFALSGSLSRHYILDRKEGKITFGDGERGMIPPRDKNNIVAKKYMSGGGNRGNVSAGIVTSLKTTIPNIEQVTNPVPSAGGMDQEDLESAVNRGPYTVKNGDRAVTREDFEWLAKEGSLYVARAKCISEDGNRITVIVVPKYEGDAPLPEAGLLESIKKYLKDRAYLTILDRIEVVGPVYKKINVKVKVRPKDISESNIVSEKIKKELQTYLHPLNGGPESEGWDFGQDIFISKMASVIEDIKGVDYVKDIEIKKTDTGEIAKGVDRIVIDAKALPCAGDITVEIEG